MGLSNIINNELVLKQLLTSQSPGTVLRNLQVTYTQNFFNFFQHFPTNQTKQINLYYYDAATQKNT